MKRLDDREQRIAYWAAALGAAVSVALWAPEFDKGAAVALAGIGLIMAALLSLAARSRSRLWTCVAAGLLAFGPWGMAWVLGLPYLALVGWLTLRSPRLRPRREAGGEPEGRVVDAAAVETAPRRRPRRRGGDDAGADGGGGGETRTPPPASKRYTPPHQRRR